MWNDFTMRHISFYYFTLTGFHMHTPFQNIICLWMYFFSMWGHTQMSFQSIYSIIHDWYLVSILEVSVGLPPTENKEVCSLALIVASQIWFLSAYLRCAYLFVCVWMCLFMSRQMQSRKCQVDHLTCIVLHQVHLLSEVWLFHLECSHRHLKSTHTHTHTHKRSDD